MELEEFLRKFIKNIDKAVDESLSKKNMARLAQNSAERIERRTRSGKGVKFHNSNETTLKSLQGSTIGIRKRLEEAGLLDIRTTPIKSNLTRSGQLLDSIKGLSQRKATGRITFNPTRNDSKNNQQIVTELEKGGFNFFKLSKKELLSLVNDYSLDLRKEFGKIFNKMKSR